VPAPAQEGIERLRWEPAWPWQRLLRLRQRAGTPVGHDRLRRPPLRRSG